MNTLYPIIRRERRPLLPPDEPVAPPVAVPEALTVVESERRSPDRPVSSIAEGHADREIGAPVFKDSMPERTFVEPLRQPKHETKTKKS